MFDQETMNNLMKTAFMAALGDGTVDRMMGEIFKTIINTKVNKHGNASYDSYGGSPDTPMLEYLLKKEFISVAQDAVREIVLTKKDEITRQIHDSILTADEKIGESIVKQILNKMYSQELTIKVNFQTEDKDDD